MTKTTTPLPHDGYTLIEWRDLLLGFIIWGYREQHEYPSGLFNRSMEVAGLKLGRLSFGFGLTRYPDDKPFWSGSWWRWRPYYYKRKGGQLDFGCFFSVGWSWRDAS